MDFCLLSRMFPLSAFTEIKLYLTSTLSWQPHCNSVLLWQLFNLQQYCQVLPISMSLAYHSLAVLHHRILPVISSDPSSSSSSNFSVNYILAFLFGTWIKFVKIIAMSRGWVTSILLIGVADEGYKIQKLSVDQPSNGRYYVSVQTPVF